MSAFRFQSVKTQSSFTFGTPDYTNISQWSRNNTNNLYNTSLANVGIGTTANTTYKLNVNGSFNPYIKVEH